MPSFARSAAGQNRSFLYAAPWLPTPQSICAHAWAPSRYLLAPQRMLKRPLAAWGRLWGH